MTLKSQISRHKTSYVEDSTIGEGTIIRKYCNIYQSHIGEHCKIASYVEIGGAKIGDACKIEAFVFIPPGVTLEDHVFVGPHTCFTNDKWPVAKPADGWRLNPTLVKDHVSIGANCTILSGVTIGEGAKVGAGSIVTKDVAPGTLVYGDGAKERGTVH